MCDLPPPKRRFRTAAGDSAVVLDACKKPCPFRWFLPPAITLFPRRFLPLPANFHHAPYVPGLAVTARSDLLIHHGGYGSCQTGLYTGTPALIIPTYSERESNARRMAAAGAGDFVFPTSDATGRNKRVSADEVRAKVFRILSDSSYRNKATRIRDRLRAFSGASRFRAAGVSDSLGPHMGAGQC